MGQVVLKLTKDKIQEMKSHYKNQLAPSIPQAAVFVAKTPYSTITAYQSGKVLFQGKDPEKEAAQWGLTNTSNTREKITKPVHEFHPPETLFHSSHIGSDEAGTGDYFGPITVAAAYVKKEHVALLKELGVKDSKHLTDEVIRKIAKDILHLDIPYTLLKLNNRKYNQLQAKGWSQGKMKTMLHHHALEKLLEKIQPEHPEGILIDQFSQPNVYKRHLATEGNKLQENVYFMTKAESYSIAVAAGSILARASFVKAMEDISKELRMDIPKGASQKVDRAAAAVISKFGKAKLQDVAKVHFATTQKADKFL
ncbi:ribonuclease HIII [Thalassobacillus pellis]|uniref:ribonuclease HIII n=1 Tax=Thalassobacillus pellis TaxID=748008 RepID=UPI001961B4C0|nr:ribonuclease HIII [Thalassobacillus pellis]MBM7555017.1 ribonuclease HIII [Thalassobacillus pellis]